MCTRFPQRRASICGRCAIPPAPRQPLQALCRAVGGVLGDILIYVYGLTSISDMLLYTTWCELHASRDGADHSCAHAPELPRVGPDACCDCATCAIGMSSHQHSLGLITRLLDTLQFTTKAHAMTDTLVSAPCAALALRRMHNTLGRGVPTTLVQQHIPTTSWRDALTHPRCQRHRVLECLERNAVVVSAGVLNTSQAYRESLCTGRLPPDT